ncbi:MAG TPA: ROK family glucokinase [Ornithinimicrobium sp.]|uniref:ROK family glucokinase n=1 Tax=Ornithinimicrobium sp. TaxID=1977084 RepID=UPI002B47DF18|nr:ROK family glucokinase [Ornithinimicrobium sp.]HKJ12099.1 ROK family glucokinase [Ornithinimicrobium sp.]
MTLNIGVDVGGTKIAAAAVDEEGVVAGRALRETPAQDVDAIADAIADIADELRDRAEDNGEEIAGVGLACAGFVDAEGANVVFAPNLAWRDEPLAARIKERTDIPVVLENDANAAAWGEFRFGAARDADHMIMVTLGTGVGGGIIDRHQLLRGSQGMAAEIGHLRVVPDGHLCGCGNRGCWEQYASGSALVRDAREVVRVDTSYAKTLRERCGGDPDELDGVMVTETAFDGDAAAVELLEDIGRWTGMGIASLVAVLDPEVIVVGGGVAAAGDLVLGPARQAFARNLTARSHRPTPPLVLAELGNDAGMIGAADLASVRAG